MLTSLFPDPSDSRAPEWGDERERSSVLAAYTRGFMYSVYGAYAVAILAALFGHVVLAVLVLIVVGSLPSYATIADARRRGVDLYALSALAPRSRRTFDTGALVVVLLAVIAAAANLALTGRPLVPPLTLPPDLLLGGCIGVPVGFGLGAVLLRRRYSTAIRRRTLDSEAEDDVE